MICHDCTEEVDVKLSGDSGLCNTHFKEHCEDSEGRPAMSHMFGQSIFMIEWDPDNGDTVPDGKAWSYVEGKIAEFIACKGDMTNTIGSEILMTAYRVAVKRGLIPNWSIIIRDRSGGYSYIDVDGNFVCLPADSLHLSKLLMELF